MKTVAELRAELEALKKKGREITAREDENGNLSAEDETAFAAVEADIEAKVAELADAEKRDDRRRKTAPIASVAALQSVTDEPNPATTGGFKSMAEFGVAVRSASMNNGFVDDRLRAALPANNHTAPGSAGEGYLVPPEYRDQVWDLMFNETDLIGRADLEATSHRQVEGAADETTPWGATGVQAYWRTEADQMTPSKMKTNGRMITLHEVYAFVTASEELLEDAPRLGQRLTTKAAQALNWKINDSVMWGTGSGTPLGFMNSPALVTVAKESGQAADTISVANVTKMFTRLIIAPGDQPIWLANIDVMPQLTTMTIGDQPVFVPATSLAAAPHGTLLGYPIIFTEHAKTLGDLGDLTLTSMKGYHALRRTSGIQAATSMHLFFDYAMTAFRWMFRFGGHPHLSAPVSPANGSNTKSHFVALAERA